MKIDSNISEKSARILEDPRLDILRDASGKLALTEQQAEATLAEGKVLVSAAAGSGKTSTLVKRILLTVAEGRATMREILVCVYNDSAQAELKQRLSASFIEAAIKETDPLRRERLLKAIDDLPFCRISTIHAFCSSLIRENFEKPGVSPTFEIADDAKMAAFMDEALNTVFDEYAEKRDADFFALIEIFSSKRNEEGLKNTVKMMYDRMILHEDRQAFRDRVCADFDHSPLHGELLDLYLRQLREAKTILEPTYQSVLYSRALCAKGIDVPLKQAIDYVDALLRAESFCDMCRVASNFAPFASHKTSRDLEGEERDAFYLAKNCIEDIAKFIGMLSGIYAKWDEYRVYHAQNAVYTAKILELAERTEAVLEQIKSENNVLGYQDLLILAKRLLDSDPDLGERFKMIFVDEYQDVDPLQESIFQRLIGEECFFVGDVKQSIYGFRLADPKILLARKEAFERGEGKVIDFTNNFRSNRDILGFVNEVFGAVMTEDSADVDYKNDGAFTIPRPEDGEEKATEKHVRLCFVKNESKSEDEKVEKAAPKGLYDITAVDEEEEDELSKADRIARFILSEINSLVGKALREDKDDGSKLSYGDIAILSRTRVNEDPNSKLSRVLETLREAGIPLDETNVGSESSDAEKELIMFLKALDNPRQDIPLTGFLLSYFGGYDEQQLADIAANRGNCFYDKLLAESKKQTELAAKLRATLAMLDDYRLKASFKSVRELMQGIASDFMYDAYMESLGEGKAVELANFIASVEEVSLGKFLREYSGSERKAIGASADSVKVSTIHKYKGLESPVVFVLDVSRVSRESTKEPIISGQGSVGMKYYDPETRTSRETFSRFALKKLLHAEDMKAEMRLMYVAFTRAKQLLYVIESVPKSYAFGKVPHLMGINDPREFLSVAKLKQSLIRQEEYIPTPVDGAPTAHAPVMNFKGDAKLNDMVANARKESYGGEEATRLAMKYSVSQLGAAEDGTEALFDERDRQAAKVGTAYHRVMQHIDLFAADLGQVEAQLEEMVSRGELSDEERSFVDAADILKCLRHPLMDMAREAYLAGGCDREKPFIMLKSAKELGIGQSEDKVLVQGVIDLYIEGEKRVIVDFKTGFSGEERVPERYKRQLYLYKTAVEAATQANVDEVYLYGFKSGKAVKVDFGGEN